MPRPRTAHGPQTSPWSMQYGRTHGPPGGMVTEKGPGRLRPEDFRLLVNARWDGDGIRARGGSEKITADALETGACVYLIDLEIGTPSKVWWIGDGCPGESAGVGFYIGSFDPEAEPQFQRTAWYQTATNLQIGKFGGELHLIVDESFRRLSLHPTPWGTEGLSQAGEIDVKLFDLPAGYEGTFIVEFDGLAFIGMWDSGAADGKVWSWDGVTHVEELAGLAASPIAAARFRDQLVVGLDGTELRVRERGAAPGSWSTISGTVDMFPGLNSMVEMFDTLWIASGGDTIYSFDGTTISAARTIASALIDSVARGHGENFDYLYYGYQDGTGDATVGRRDRAGTYTDAHKDLDAQYSGSTRVPGLQWFRDSLLAAVLNPAGARVLISRGSATSGTWDVHFPPTGFANDIRYATVI